MSTVPRVVEPILCPLLGALGVALVAPSALIAFLVAVAGLLALPRVAARTLGDAAGSGAWAPLQFGLAAPVLGIPLEPFLFRDPGLLLLLAGAAVGGLSSARRLRRAGWRPRPTATQTALLAGAVALLIAPLWTTPHGDEPHYLLVAHSLAEDRDLDLATDYGERAYAGFHPDPLSPHYKPGLRPGSRYSMHGVGYPLVILPAYALGSVASPHLAVLLPRILQILMLGLFAAIVHGLVRELVDAPAATLAAPAAVSTAPLLLAPLHLFPETAAMTAAAGGYLLVLRRRDLPAGVVLALLPWLGVKYIPLAAAVALAAWAARADRRPFEAVRLLTPLALSLLGHALFTWMLYGSISPSAVYLGSDPDFGRQPGFGSDWAAYLADWPRALATFVGYFLDQKEGLLAVAPLYLIGAAGVPLLLRRNAVAALGLVAVLAAHLVPYALSQQLGGQSPPARPVTAVVWTLIPFVGAGLIATGRLVTSLRGALLALSGVLTTVLILDPTLLPHDYPIKQSRLLMAIAPADVELWRWFPQWVNFAESNWTVTALWLAATVATAFALGRAGRAALAVDAATDPGLSSGTAAPSASTGTPDDADGRAWGGAVVVVVGAMVVALAAAATPVSARHVGAPLAPGVRAWVRASVPESAWPEAGNVWVRPGAAREIVLTTDEPLGSPTVILRVLSPATVRLAAAATDVEVELEPGRGWRGTVDLGAGRSWRGGWAYRLTLAASAGAAPALVEGGDDWRQLGVALRLEADRGVR